MNTFDFCKLSQRLYLRSGQRRARSTVLEDLCSISRIDSCNQNAADSWIWRIGVRRVCCGGRLLVKSHPRVSVIRHRVGARLFEHTFDRVGGAGHVAGRFQARESWGEEKRQREDDRDDYEQLDERESVGRTRVGSRSMHGGRGRKSGPVISEWQNVGRRKMGRKLKTES